MSEKKPLGFREDGEAEWEQIGPGVTFAQLSKKYLKQFETEESTSGKAEKISMESHNPAGTKRGRKSKQ